MQYRILGSIEVLDPSGRKLPLGGAMQQSVLASLLLRAGQTVVLDRLVDELWDEPPATAARTVQAYVSRLRHELPKRAIEGRPGGYVLLLDGDELDLEAFGRWAEEGHTALAAGDHEQAASLLREALALWRGPALAGLTSEALRRQAERLEELRLGALEDRLDADLESARHSEIVPELTALVAEHPFRERLRAQLMRALVRSGRPGDALALYRETRRLLVEELGMEPGQELRELEQAILRQDAELEAPELKRPVLLVEPLASKPPVAQGPPRQVRKTVTVLSCGLVTSTALSEATDPEALQALLARYSDRMKTIVERHGGTVEKFIDDAIMAVFGVPLAHEDDALRACRAALDMRDGFPELGVEGRIGITTGEVVTGTEERLATGDPMNVAARLQQTAQPGDVLVGEPTLQLVGDAAEVEAPQSLPLKGKRQPVEAYRLRAVRELPSRPKARFVGRQQELTAVHEAWHRALAEERCELFTVIGEAGVGKSRLVAEALASFDPRVVQGRCLPYGEGITYWPVVEILRQLDAKPSDDAAAAAIGSLLGETDVATSAEEIAWAVRKLLEEQAPLIAVFDDIQSGEETFLDLLEHVALLSSGKPILLLAMARPELTERRAEWPVMLRLEPLGAEEAEELIPQGISGGLRAEIARAAGGNPLFVEEMVAVAGDAGGEVVVPPTLHALLATRLDQLDAAEREVLERGAIEGELFHRGSVQALTDEQGQVTPRLASLVRKGLIRPQKSQLADEDGFRFRHLLIRDAAYAGLPKTTRAELHERFAFWLEQNGAELVELDELLGFHLEQSFRYRADLDLPRDDGLAAEASRRLMAGGRRAARRQDYGAAASLLERAAGLLSESEVDLALETELSDVLFWDGRQDEALRRADALAARASDAGDRVGELCGRLQRAMLLANVEPENLASLVEKALPVFEGAGDDLALYIGYFALGEVSTVRGRLDAALRAYERAFTHAERAGHEPSSMVGVVAWCRFAGTSPVSELLAWLDEIEPRAGRNRFRGWSLARLGRFQEARAMIAEERADQLERGGGILLANLTAFESVGVELLAGDPAAAAEFAAEGLRLHEESGQQTFLAPASAFMAQVAYALDQLEDAEAWAARALELSTSDDAGTEALWRQVRGKVLARRGEHAEAQRLAQEAVTMIADSDLLNAQGDAYADLGEVLQLTGKPDEAAAALGQALARYEQKENVVMAERVRARLAELRPSEAAAGTA